MNASPALANALRAFASVERQIVALSDHRDITDPGELVRLRRQLVDEFAAISAALEREPALRADPDRMAQATRLLSAFRTQNAINQAEWPAIRARDDTENYRRASRRVSEQSQIFWQWVDRELGIIP